MARRTVRMREREGGRCTVKREGEGEGEGTHRDQGGCAENIHHQTILPNFIAHGGLHHARLNPIDEIDIHREGEGGRRRKKENEMERRGGRRKEYTP